MKSSLSRLTALEHSCLQDPLIVLAEDDNGNAEKMSVQEMLSSGRGFAKVVRGSRLSDLDKLCWFSVIVHYKLHRIVQQIISQKNYNLKGISKNE